MNKITELNNLTKQLRGIANRNFWAKRKDDILVTQPNGRRYNWHRINPDSEKARPKIKQMKENRK